MRMVYLDELGTGDPKREPFVIVAAVIVHADKQWKAIGKYLADLAEAVVPPEKKRVFKAFHANELYSGGRIFERKPGQHGVWWPVLENLLSVPRKFDLPISFGFTKRAWFEPGSDHHDALIAAKIPPIAGAQMAAFTMATVGVEHWMKRMAGADEVAQMVMENNPHAQKFISETHRVIANPKLRVALLKPREREVVDISRIMSPIYFQDKIDSSVLQIADACAWAIRRRISRERDSERFYTPVRGQFINDVSVLLEAGDAPSFDDEPPTDPDQASAVVTGRSS